MSQKQLSMNSRYEAADDFHYLAIHPQHLSD